ncbi:Os11g0277100 [Oryza sativa Japonica Group]|uniref:Os11g0277100 protein n=1 Tax=Oryza sativa subsp. japonica TaxID=39947 RepID=A0A0N7KSS0_ORYSJ|nr:Os11g0277100 [Oryza sativa Japonica Group]
MDSVAAARGRADIVTTTMTTMGCAVLPRRSGDDNNDSKPSGGGSGEPGPRRDGSAYVGLWCSRVSTTMVAAARTDLG